MFTFLTEDSEISNDWELRSLESINGFLLNVAFNVRSAIICLVGMDEGETCPCVLVVGRILSVRFSNSLALMGWTFRVSYR